MFAEISHRVTKLIQISMPSWLDCYESIYFFLLCTTGKISVSRGGEIKRFHPLWKPAPQKTAENHHWKYCNNFFPSHIAVTSMLLSYWYHSQQLTDASCYRQKYIIPQRFNLFNWFHWKKLHAYLAWVRPLSRLVIRGRTLTSRIPSIIRESFVPTGIRLPYIKRKNQLMNR